jgi:hypothetical protein
MRARGLSFQRSEVLIIGACLLLSVIIGIASGSQAGTRALALVAGVLLFAALVWDLRLVLPILIFTLPFGPRFPMSFGNLYLSTVIVIIAYAAWIIRMPLAAREFSLRLNSVAMGIIGLMVALVLTALQDVGLLLSNQASLLRFIQFYLYTGLFIMIWQMSLSPLEIKVLLVLVLIAGLGEGVIGAVQWLKHPGMYVVGTFDYSHNSFSCYVTFISVLLLGIVLRTRSRVMGIGCVLGIAFLLYSILFSFSRTAYVSLGVSLLTFLFLPVARIRKIMLVVFSCAGLVVILLMTPVSVIHRAFDVYLTLAGRQTALSFFYRIRSWKEALRGFLENPILGQGTWYYAIRDNFFVKIAAESGLVGSLAFITLIYLILRSERRAFSACPEDGLVKGITLGLYPASIGFLIVFNLSGDFPLVHRVTGTFWIVLALILKYSLNQAGTKNERQPQTGKSALR